VTFPSVRRLGIALGAIFVLLGVIEVITHRGDTAGALAFWGLSLLGGGALVLADTLVRPTRRTLGLTLLIIGAVADTKRERLDPAHPDLRHRDGRRGVPRSRTSDNSRLIAGLWRRHDPQTP
jgi:hypothetical protein